MKEWGPAVFRSRATFQYFHPRERLAKLKLELHATENREVRTRECQAKREEVLW